MATLCDTLNALRPGEDGKSKVSLYGSVYLAAGGASHMAYLGPLSVEVETIDRAVEGAEGLATRVKIASDDLISHVHSFCPAGGWEDVDGDGARIGIKAGPYQRTIVYPEKPKPA